LQDKLDLSSVDTGECRQLPSPQSLKGKILVKVTTYGVTAQTLKQ
jgi:phosphatidylinositol phospholipase C eta